MFYSASTMGFYIGSESHAPSDLVEITDEQYSSLFDGQAQGKIISPDENGFPVLLDPPAPSASELQEIANTQARAFLASTDWYVTRNIETGASIPTEITTQRQQARASII
jgi:hypothetical protein